MSSQESAVIEARTLLSGLVIGESARWHEGRLWFAHWGTGEIVAVDLDGRSEVVGQGPPGLGWSIDWLPDGRLLVTGEELMRREPDGTMVRHADLSGMGVDGFQRDRRRRPRQHLRQRRLRFRSRRRECPRVIALVTPDGSVSRVADGIAFPNGMAVTPDNSTLIIAESFAGRLTAFDIAADGGLSNRRVWADGVGPDGICMDAGGAVWTGVGGFTDNHVGRVREGGDVLERVHLDLPCFACMLGGEDGQTLFMLAADWRMNDGFDENIARLTRGPRTGQLLTAPAPTAGVGWP